ncbi:MAG: hypothetical protein UT65_C0008G0007 [Parcubacteria group bacterium GW2011_GWF2_39_8b]|uniref:DUF2283 domain-containing protein n=3 Tax=Candidatus Zambryskiibacteriota TaxID=1817925 RepID=A0A1G2TB58_9BACT|nr:MAG: hypothetical protein UT65_C0008G0007 [Parcubacteria group bacterium GW2011_GWF2_39_8b]KKR45722.1 MAG: hypothetical protein UT81_C0007G0004 [Parcubacteria group bacterium GW2011_GWA2_40_14]OHA93841.1 MAG: hypothetical protein A2W58_00825 [Candidatus Zambryskibacteria bacterium RIFCSPHIGHO2_02_38_10.5]OHA95722.1 MAG: hypothetical protein A3C63_00595 [Candidatus Zambryskibacteria bacterium RIFCSPHIGHO2_02_FULL_39_82]OHA97851.1 MAG: hypothetical protein A3E32_02635 [Candidatus Zambryskibact
MKFSYNKKIDALYIRFNDKPIIESDQVSDSIIIDYDKNGRIIALEILDASKKMAKDIYSNFLKKNLPINLELVSR